MALDAQFFNIAYGNEFGIQGEVTKKLITLLTFYF